MTETFPTHDQKGIPNPRSLKAIEFDIATAKANKATPRKDEDPEPSYLLPILLIILGLAAILGVLAFYVASNPG